MPGQVAAIALGAMGAAADAVKGETVSVKGRIAKMKTKVEIHRIVIERLLRKFVVTTIELLFDIEKKLYTTHCLAFS